MVEEQGAATGAANGAAAGAAPAAAAADAATFSLADEDHTLGNALRVVLNQDPRVAFCGYSVPHPSEARVNVRVQTTGDPAQDVFKDALEDLASICDFVRATFEDAVADFKRKQLDAPAPMDV
eukprot:SM000003S10998  [mRNA]  locus=s3:247137:247838:+ [translate_table: standard]